MMKTQKFLMVTAMFVVAMGCSKPQSAGKDGSSGNSNARSVIQNKGSDTLVNVAQAWAENYKTVDATVGVAVAGGGSGTGISSLINGTVDLANASRKMKQKEIDLAKSKGIDPIEHVVGYDALAVYVHPSNPIESITLEQLATIYGEHGTSENWSHLNLTVPGAADGKIIRVSRQNNSGTYAYFKKAVLGKGKEYKLGSLDMHGSKDVVDLVAKTPGAIGYSGLAYATPEVKMVPVLSKEGTPITPSTATASDGSYPIARPLLMYTSGQPTGKVKKYLDWILSPTGQKIILAKGYAPATKLK
jgi:phosphate transport system substrate-binding protein